MESAVERLFEVYGGSISIADLRGILGENGCVDVMDESEIDSAMLLINPQFRGAFCTVEELSRAVYVFSGCGRDTSRALFLYADTGRRGAIDKLSLVTVLSQLNVGLTDAACDELLRVYGSEGEGEGMTPIPCLASVASTGALSPS